MGGSELGVFVKARDQRDAFLIAHRVYGEIRERAGLRGRVGQIVAFAPPTH
jgi:hypothetical protein